MDKITISKLNDPKKTLIESDDPIFLLFEIDGKKTAQTCSIRSLKWALNAFFNDTYDPAKSKTNLNTPLQS